jgi:spore coat protein CotF
MNNISMTDKDHLFDVLSCEKKMSSSYNEFAYECSNQQLKRDFLNILNDVQQIQSDLFNEAQTRGWYSIPQAEQQKVEQAKQKYSNMSF